MAATATAARGALAAGRIGSVSPNRASLPHHLTRRPNMLRMYVIATRAGPLILNAADDTAALARTSGGRIIHRSDLVAGLSPSPICGSASGTW